MGRRDVSGARTRPAGWGRARRLSQGLIIVVLFYLSGGKEEGGVGNALSWEAREGGSLPPAVMSPPHPGPQASASPSLMGMSPMLSIATRIKGKRDNSAASPA